MPFLTCTHSVDEKNKRIIYNIRLEGFAVTHLWDYEQEEVNDWFVEKTQELLMHQVSVYLDYCRRKNEIVDHMDYLRYIYGKDKYYEEIRDECFKKAIENDVDGFFRSILYNGATPDFIKYLVEKGIL